MFQPVFNRDRDRYEVNPGMSMAASAAQMLLALEAHPWLMPCAAAAISQLPGAIALPFSLLCMETNKVMPTDIAHELGHEIRDAHMAQMAREIPIGPHLRRQYRALTLFYPAYGDRRPHQYLGQLSVCLDRDGDGINVHFHRDDDSICGWNELLDALLVELREQPSGSHNLLWDLPGALCWRAAMAFYKPSELPQRRELLFNRFTDAAANRCRAMGHKLLALQCRYVRAHASHPVSNN